MNNNFPYSSDVAGEAAEARYSRILKMIEKGDKATARRLSSQAKEDFSFMPEWTKKFTYLCRKAQ